MREMSGDATAPQVRGGDASTARITLVGKPGCHLCDEARAVIASVAAEMGIGWDERSILDDPELYEQYCEQIPVTLVDGRRHDYWRVDPERLRRALAGRSR
jgi:Glutaredoxin-like domain (DUF836)